MKSDNELIAEFMGNRVKILRGKLVINYEVWGRKRLWREPQYLTSWDWLMPVIERIEETEDKYDTRINYYADEGCYFCDIVDMDNTDRACQKSYNSKIEAVYNAVVEFIKWHNSTKSLN